MSITARVPEGPLLERARDLILTRGGAVKRQEFGSVVVYLMPAREPGRYYKTYIEPRTHCSCPAYGFKPDQYCKHIVAAFILQDQLAAHEGHEGRAS